MAIKVTDFDVIKDRVKKMAVGVAKRDIEVIGTAMVSAMKGLIASGISPIQGRGRFQAYRGKYPASVRAKYPSKRERPVNLSLSGDFLANLDSKVDASRSQSGVTQLSIGFTDNLSKKKEQGHRDGANGQAERPIIPQGREVFAVTVRRIAVDGFRQALQASVKRNTGT